MTRKQFLAAAAGAFASPIIAQSAKKRNVILILSDDHRYDMMSALGHPWLQTKYLDKMIAGGALFENAFATTAHSNSSRASILTGQYAHTHGVVDSSTHLAASALTFPQILQQNGYKTALIGKWNLNGDTDEPRPGFNRWVSFRGQGVFKDPTMNIDGERKRIPGHVSDVLTSEASKFISQHAGQSQPFFLLMSHKAGQPEFQPADRHKPLYSSEPIPFPKSMGNTEQNYRGRPQWVKRQRDSWHGVDGMYNRRFNFDQFYRDYCRTLMSIDDNVGSVMEDLSRRKLLDETLIIYTSSSGFMLGDHGLIDKRSMYEPSMRIPMIFHCPELIKADTKLAGMTLNIDVAPTILELAGIRPSPSVHGRSLIPLIKGGDPVRTEFLYEYFWERESPHTPTVLGIRTDKHSYMQYHGVWDLDELYDIQEDADQLNNLVGHAQVRTESGSVEKMIKDPEARKIVDDLQARMQKIIEQTGGQPELRWKA